jgi:hypothetical protein
MVGEGYKIMPKYHLTSPDGKQYEVDAPEGASEQDAIEYVQKNHVQPAKEPATKDQEIRASFINRLGFGAMEPMIGAGQLLAHGLDAIAAPGSMAEGLGNTVDDYWKSEKDKQDEAKLATSTGFDAAGLAGNIISPVNALLVGKAPQAANLAGKVAQSALTGAKVGASMPTYGDNFATDKAKQVATQAALSGALPVVGEGIKKLGGYTADIIGGIGTHTGGEGIKEAAKAGMEGGQRAETFINNLREDVPKTDVLDVAKENLQRMGEQKSRAYREGMAQVSGDKTVLSFNGIDGAIKNAVDTVTYKGEVKNQRGADAVTRVAEEISKWKQLNPSEYHTPEGIDALKQKISGIQESIPFEEKTARKAVGGIYNAVKGEISRQAPVYDKVMKDYSQGSELINEIERSLSLGKKASEDTSMRKLQSLMRNNVNTNYGNRLQLANELQSQGGNDIMAGLAGQSLSSITPRGLGGIVAGATGLGGLAMSNPLAVPLLALQSPRLVGEGAYYGGKTAGSVGKVADKIPGKTLIANYLINKARGE